MSLTDLPYKNRNSVRPCSDFYFFAGKANWIIMQRRVNLIISAVIFLPLATVSLLLFR